MLINSIKGSLNVITGCGSGLGRGTLFWFLKNGSGPILAIDRKFDSGFHESLKSLSGEQRKNITLREHWTSDESASEASLSEFVKNHGRIDNLINVAGVACSFVLQTKDSSTTYNLDHVHHLTDFNTVGTFNLIRLVSKYMIEENLELKKLKKQQARKCIVNTSCISTHSPNPGQSFYAGSMSAIDSMTLCIARELSPFNIRCNTIDVGYFDTLLVNCLDERIPLFLADEVALCPKKLGHPEEFAHLCKTIIENEMINGACIRLDAGAKEVH